VLFQLDASIDSRREIAPNYDHAAGLGQILSDQERAGRLGTNDRGYSIESWAAKARGALYGDPLDRRPLTTFDAFARASKRYPRAGEYWLDRLSRVEVSAWIEVQDRLPDGCTSLVTKTFTSRMLDTNRTYLLDRT